MNRARENASGAKSYHSTVLIFARSELPLPKSARNAFTTSRRGAAAIFHPRDERAGKRPCETPLLCCRKIDGGDVFTVSGRPERLAAVVAKNKSFPPWRTALHQKTMRLRTDGEN
ncbi:hypothetical protein J6590_079274 [Homalodisca vitripennis]|nr:hypothetical protein J6590_079274 [Homalodisca vitripennis]